MNKSNYNVRVYFEVEDYERRVAKESEVNNSLAVNGPGNFGLSITRFLHVVFEVVGSNKPSSIFVKKHSEVKVYIPKKLLLYSICSKGGRPLGYRNNAQITRRIEIDSDFNDFVDQLSSSDIDEDSNVVVESLTRFFHGMVGHELGVAVPRAVALSAPLVACVFLARVLHRGMHPVHDLNSAWRGWLARLI